MAALKKPRRLRGSGSRPKASGKKLVKKIKLKKAKKVVKKVVSKLKKATARKSTAKKAGRKVGSSAKTVKKKFLSIVKKFKGNPIIEPERNSSWESEAVFNPAAVVHDGRVHLFYRALGPDGVSRIGHMSSSDGIYFEGRLSYPVYTAENLNEHIQHFPYTSPVHLVYDPVLYASGGGWGGCEDPRAVKIDGRIYMTFNMFAGWNSMRVAVTSIDSDDLANNKWNWSYFTYLSRPGDRQKNWVLFPEKINGKFALFHNLDKGDPSRVHIAYLDNLNMQEAPTQQEAPDPHTLPDHIVAWHNRTRSAAAPPLKTPDGWLLFYHAMDKDDPGRYKVGAMLLDLKDPTRVLYRLPHPIIQPDEWYENDWKPGIVYLSGAVVKDGTLFLYYGGGDKHIAVAYTPLNQFLRQLKNKEHMVFSKSLIKI